MADFEKLLKDHAGDDGSIPASAIGAAVTAIRNAVGNEYVEKERYKAKLAEIDSLKERQQTAEDNATTAEKWKTKYEALKDEFADYKKTESEKVALTTKQNAYRELLKAEGISDKRIETIVKVTDFATIKVDKDGKIEDEAGHRKTINSEWGDFKVSHDTKGASVSTPPNAMKGAVMSKADIMAIKDTGERQAAWANYLNAQKD